jgi:hypothetical protein
MNLRKDSKEKFLEVYVKEYPGCNLKWNYGLVPRTSP